MIWVVFAFMTGAAVLSVLWPLARVPRAVGRRESDRLFYEGQLAGIDRDIGSGLLSASEGEAAKAEAARRLLAVSTGPDVSAGSLTARRLAALATLVAVPVLAIGTYAALGHPDLPDEPLSARMSEPPGKMDIGVAVARIEKHLAENPKDGRGWELLAPVYMRLGRPDDAARAYAKAIEILGDDPQREAARGEALTTAANGRVSEDAVKAFDRALALDPKNPSARYYLGMQAEQVGDRAKAQKIWSDLMTDSPPGAPWLPYVKQRLVEIGAPVPATAADAVAAMAPKDQATFIRGMVAGLAQRLAAGGGSVDDWGKLVRAYVVLKEPDKARAALADARKGLAGNANALTQLDTLARQLGLEG